MFTPTQQHAQPRDAEFPPLLFSLSNLDQVTPRAQTPGRTTTENSRGGSMSYSRRSGTPGSTTHGEATPQPPPIDRLARDDVVMGECTDAHRFVIVHINLRILALTSRGMYGTASPCLCPVYWKPSRSEVYPHVRPENKMTRHTISRTLICGSGQYVKCAVRTCICKGFGSDLVLTTAPARALTKF